MSELNEFHAGIFRVNRHYQQMMFEHALSAAQEWAKNTDPFAIAAKNYWLSQAIGWASR